jgi:tellurite resistance protein TehA-like permease
MLRSLPFSSENLLWAELVIPWSLTVATGWLAIIFSSAGLGAFHLPVALLVPPICMILSLIAAYDVFRQSTSEMLLNGNIPGISALTILGGAICLAIPAGIIWWLSQLWWIGVFLAIVVSLLLAYGLWHMAAKRYRSIS